MIAKTRKEATQMGVKVFTPDTPCKKGHMSEHRVQGGCKKCRANAMAQKRKDPEFREAARIKSLELYHSKYAADETIRERMRAYRERKKQDVEFINRRRAADNAYKASERAKSLRQASMAKLRQDSEWREARNKRARERDAERYRTDPEYRARLLEQRSKRRATKKGKLEWFCRNSLRRCLVQKASRRTLDILSYSFDDLASHIEAQFSEGMNWENYGEWHIDHIDPLSAMLGRGERDPSIINALSNLRPLWAKENSSLGGKLRHAK